MGLKAHYELSKCMSIRLFCCKQSQTSSIESLTSEACVSYCGHLLSLQVSASFSDMACISRHYRQTFCSF